MPIIENNNITYQLQNTHHSINNAYKDIHNLELRVKMMTCVNKHFYELNVAREIQMMHSLSLTIPRIPHDDRWCSHRVHFTLPCCPRSFSTFQMTTLKYKHHDSDQHRQIYVYKFLQYKSASAPTKSDTK